MDRLEAEREASLLKVYRSRCAYRVSSYVVHSLKPLWRLSPAISAPRVPCMRVIRPRKSKVQWVYRAVRCGRGGCVRFGAPLLLALSLACGCIRGSQAVSDCHWLEASGLVPGCGTLFRRVSGRSAHPIHRKPDRTPGGVWVPVRRVSPLKLFTESAC